MNERERWVALQGPAPPEIRELFDAMRAPVSEDLELTPEREGHLNRRLFAAVAEQERRWAAKRRRKRAMMGVAALGLLAAGFGGAIVLGEALADAFRGAAPHASMVTKGPLPFASEPTPSPSATPSATPPVSGKSPPPRGRGPGR